MYFAVCAGSTLIMWVLDRCEKKLFVGKKIKVADIRGGKRMWKPVASVVFKRRRMMGKFRKRTFVLTLILGGDIAARLMHAHSNSRNMAAHAGALRRHAEAHDSSLNLL